MTHYQWARRNGFLWQYVRLEDDVVDSINWMFEFEYDELVLGLREYISGDWQALIELEWSGRRPNSEGYDRSGFCYECGDYGLYSRGLCRICYDDAHHNHRLFLYPSQAFTSNVPGTVYQLLNNHLDLVIQVGKDMWGVEISSVQP